MFFIVDGGTAIISEAARVVPDLQDKNAMSALGNYALQQTIARFPSIKDLRWASESAKDTAAAINRNSLTRMLSSRVSTLFY